MEQGGSIAHLVLNDDADADLRVPPDSPALAWAHTPRGKVPGVRLGVLDPARRRADMIEGPAIDLGKGPLWRIALMDMDPRYHPAQAALAAGDIGNLSAILAIEPDLATARSGRSHPTLLQCLVLSMPPVDRLEEMIKLLADHGAELSGPLVAAAGINNLRAITTLLDLGAPVDGEGEWTPLGGGPVLWA